MKPFQFFNRLSYKQKFFLISLLFILSLAGFFPMGQDLVLRREQYGVRELEGTYFLRPLQSLLANANHYHLTALQQYHGQDVAAKLTALETTINQDMAELAQVDEAYGASLQLNAEPQQILQSWETLKATVVQADLAGQEAAYSQLDQQIQQLIRHVGDTSFLILDPDLDTYYMMDAVLLKLPELQKLLNEIAHIAIHADIEGELIQADRREIVALNSQIQSLLTQIKEHSEISWENDTTGQMRALTELPLQEMDGLIGDYLTQGNEQIDLSNQPDFLIELNAGQDDVQAALTTFYNAVSEALAFGIENRIQRFTSRLIVAMGIAFVAIMMALIVELVVFRSISRPLNELISAASRLGAGEWHVRVLATGDDETGRVGQAFNRMAAELQMSQQKLAEQVDALSQLTRALEASGRISRQLSTILDPDELTTEVVHQLQQAFNYYHAHIYVFDEKENLLVMAGGTGSVGRKLLAANHKIALGQGIVGRAASSKESILVSDVRQDESWLPNPLLPETKSEAAVPIVLGERMLGVLDVQHDNVNGLTWNDLTLLQSIADQVAVALQNARAYLAAQTQANREAVINDINRRIQMATDVETVLQIAARELGKVLDAERVDVQIGLQSANNGRSLN